MLEFGLGRSKYSLNCNEMEREGEVSVAAPCHRLGLGLAHLGELDHTILPVRVTVLRGWGYHRAVNIFVALRGEIRMPPIPTILCTNLFRKKKGTVAFRCCSGDGGITSAGWLHRVGRQ